MHFHVNAVVVRRTGLRVSYPYVREVKSAPRPSQKIGKHVFDEIRNWR